MFFRQIADSSLAHYSYLIGCQRVGEAIVIDPQRDIDRYHELAEENNLRIVAAADTHIHADYLSGTREFAENESITVYLSKEGGPDWQYNWAKGKKNIVLIGDDSRFSIGNIHFRVQKTDGHTPEHVAYFVYDGGAKATTPMGVCSGDFLFVGTLGRPDLLESAAGMQGIAAPSARALYKSVQRFRDTGGEIQVWPAHGAGSACGKDLGAVPISTVGYEKKYNEALIVGETKSEEEFVNYILGGQPEPPLYWAEMKRLNRDGAAVLGKIPQPPKMSASEIFSANATVIDGRHCRKEFFAKHLAGSIYAAHEDGMSQIVGSFLPLGTPLILLLQKECCLESVVRELLRVGFDNFAGWAVADAILADPASSEKITQIKSIPRDNISAILAKTPNMQWLDVRTAKEFAEEGGDPKAINIAHTRLLARYDEIPSGKDLLVSCASGKRASFSASFLANKGHKVVHVEG